MRVLWTPLEEFIRCTVTARLLIIDYAEGRVGVFRISVYVGGNVICIDFTKLVIDIH